LEPIKEIVLQSLGIFILILGSMGLLISSLLLFSPRLVKTFSDILDRKIIDDKKLSCLNRTIHMGRITYRFHIPIGLMFAGGSIFVLVFLFFLIEIMTGVLVLVGKIAAFSGLTLGFLLLFSPATMVRIETRMDAWFATQFMIDKLDEFHHDVDELILKYPLLFGFAGLMTSFVLILLALTGILT
jgi:hypothetical protein